MHWLGRFCCRCRVRLPGTSAAGAGTSGLTLFTLTHEAHIGERVMLGAEILLHAAGVHPPGSEMEWVPWADSTGCAP